MIINEKTKSREEEVYQKLEEEILAGMYKRGSALTEMSVSSRLQVSRTPVRAALHRLAEEGLVEIAPNRGAVVVGVTVDDLIDTYKIRIRLEGLASSMATERMSVEEKKQLVDSVELSEYYMAKGDTERLKELDSEFHNIIYRASGNRMLSKILSELHRNIKAYRKLSLTVPGRLEKTVHEHRAILDAILSSDSDKADKLTRIHVEHAMENMVKAMQNKE
ncbi:MAG: GntR family transcriptional regulator [Clostridia bacterium]|nr:GntR family transcriptional regulator [Clostridia bacterium]